MKQLRCVKGKNEGISRIGIRDLTNTDAVLLLCFYQFLCSALQLVATTNKHIHQNRTTIFIATTGPMKNWVIQRDTARFEEKFARTFSCCTISTISYWNLKPTKRITCTVRKFSCWQIFSWLPKSQELPYNHTDVDPCLLLLGIYTTVHVLTSRWLETLLPSLSEDSLSSSSEMSSCKLEEKGLKRDAWLLDVQKRRVL